MSKQDIRDLKIKTNTVKRCVKDLDESDKEIAKQEALIEKTKNDPEKDEHDVRKQKEVLDELVQGKPLELDALKQRMEELEVLLEEKKDDAQLVELEEWGLANQVLETANAAVRKHDPHYED